MSSFAGKTVLVSGASSGIGAALAAVLLEMGARVTVCARRVQRLERLAQEYPGRVLALGADVTIPAQRQAMISGTLEKWEGLDLLVNNAGLGAYADFLGTPEEQWRRLFEVNLFAPVELTRLALPHMLGQGSGMVLNIASIGGLLAHAEKVTAYVASKHALVGFSRGLAKDLAGTGVSVKAACPHLTDTEFFQSGQGAREMSGEIAKYKNFLDTPDQVARGILDQLYGEALLIFPTPKSAQAYRKMEAL